MDYKHAVMINKSKQKRLSYIDEMKGFAILCVVLGHIPHSFIEHGIADGVAAKFLLDIMNVIYVFHMPLFMMISGYLYNKAYFIQKQNKKRIYSQVGNLLCVYVISNVGYALLKTIAGGVLKKT